MLIALGEQSSFLIDLFRAAIAAADPAKVVPPHLPQPPRHGRTIGTRCREGIGGNG
jgi:glycerate-2-kinase